MDEVISGAAMYLYNTDNQSDAKLLSGHTCDSGLCQPVQEL